MTRLLVTLLCAGGTLVPPVSAQEPNRGGAIDLTSRDLRVAQERIKMAPGYEVNLFASEQEFPEIAKPVAIAFDAYAAVSAGVRCADITRASCLMPKRVRISAA